MSPVEPRLPRPPQGPHAPRRGSDRPFVRARLSVTWARTPGAGEQALAAPAPAEGALIRVNWGGSVTHFLPARSIPAGEEEEEEEEGVVTPLREQGHNKPLFWQISGRHPHPEPSRHRCPRPRSTATASAQPVLFRFQNKIKRSNRFTAGRGTAGSSSGVGGHSKPLQERGRRSRPAAPRAGQTRLFRGSAGRLGPRRYLTRCAMSQLASRVRGPSTSTPFSVAMATSY